MEWSNLLLSCPSCNGKNAKGNRFPLVDFNKRSRAINPIRNPPLSFDRTQCIANQSPLFDEEPLLINPEYEDPARYLTFDEFGQIYGIGEKGATTVDILKLHRDPLLVARQAKLNSIIEEINLACAARQINRIDDSGLRVWFEKECTKVLELDNVRNEYCLWGRHIIANFESCVVSKIPIYKDELRDAFQQIR